MLCIPFVAPIAPMFGGSMPDRMIMHKLCILIHRNPYGIRIPGIMGA